MFNISFNDCLKIVIMTLKIFSQSYKKRFFLSHYNVLTIYFVK